MKKTFSILLATVSVLIFGAVSAAAEDVSVDTNKAVEASNGVTFSVTSRELAASQFKDDTKITVTCDGAEGDESPVKLVLNYWHSDADVNNGIGEPASAEVEASEFADGAAVFEQSAILEALGDNDLSMVYSIDVLAGDKAVTCTGFEASDVYSKADMVENDILYANWVHPRKPKETDNWGQSVSIGVDQFDTSTMTDKTWVIAQFESDLAENIPNAPVEFILQSTDDTVSPKAKNGTVWGKVSPVLYNENFALFDYADMVDAYGTDDMSCVSIVYVGDTGNGKIKCTDLYALRCKVLKSDIPAEPVTSEVPAEESTVEDSAAVSSSAEVSAADATDSSNADKEKGSVRNNLVLIIIGAVAGIAVAGLILYIVLGRKSRETYDVNSHKFIKK